MEGNFLQYFFSKEIKLLNKNSQVISNKGIYVRNNYEDLKVEHLMKLNYLSILKR